MANKHLESLQFPGLSDIYTMTPEIASEYSSSATYAVGDYAVHSGKLYQCTTAIATAEAWTAAHWTEAKLADDVSQLKEDLDGVDDEITQLKEDVGDLSDLETTDKSSIVAAVNEAAESGGSGLSDNIKIALLQIASKVAYTDAHGQDYYEDLYEALYETTGISLNAYSAQLNAGDTFQLVATTIPAGGVVRFSSSDTTVATVSSTGLITSLAVGYATITATCGSVSASCELSVSAAVLSYITSVFDTHGATIYTSNTLNDLKQYLTVTAHYSDSTTQTVTAYTLNGSLTAGTNSITVSYQGKTTTFNVTVVAVALSSISVVFDQQGNTVYESTPLNDLKQYAVVTAHYNDSSTSVVTNYTLSGSLTAGTSVISVSYQGKTTTFNVTVTAVTLTSIGAVFDTQGQTIYIDNALDDLKQYLTVTASYSNGTTQAITNYTLSGSLTAGTNTITVSYQNKTDTFNVSVTDDSLYSLTNTVIDTSSTCPNTGLKLLETDRDFTILFDATQDSTTFTRKVRVFASSHAEHNWKGIFFGAGQGGGRYGIQWMTQDTQILGTGGLAGGFSIRCAYVHSQGTDSMQFTYKVDDGEVTVVNQTEAIILQDSVLRFGGSSDDKTQNWPGTIHKAAVYPRVLSNSYIEKFVNGTL